MKKAVLDALAYTYVTGWNRTHMHLSTYLAAAKLTALDMATVRHVITDETVRTQLEQHPMVKAVRELETKGYTVGSPAKQTRRGKYVEMIAPNSTRSRSVYLSGYVTEEC